jgi:integron integrase
MEPIPKDVLIQFDDILKQRNVPLSSHADYRKWLRYFLDYRAKYSPPDAKSDQVRLFAEKLRSKNQTAKQLEEAADAVSLLFALQQRKSNESGKQDVGKTTFSQTQPHLNPPLEGEETDKSSHRPVTGEKVGSTVLLSGVTEVSGDGSSPAASVRPFAPRSRGGNRYDEWRCLNKTESPAWDKVIADLAAEIKLRHYSRNTLKAYADWSRKFQNYLKDKPPEALSPAEVKAYLTYLAVDCKVSSSHQNLAFNALLFLYRYVLKMDFGIHKDIPRAKQSTFIPVVLSRQEIDAVLAHLAHPYKLIAQLQYGCGLRINESVTLRAKDFNFDAGILTVRGKGNKCRTVPVPKLITPELQSQMEAVKKLHDEDLEAGFAGVFLDDQLEKKYPKAAKELVWQWFMPQESLTFVADAKELRRYHLHKTHVQDALYEAVRKAKLTKRVTAHTFRHCYATHLLQAGYDLRTIQMLLGHADIRPTMIYLHCIPGKPEKEVKSPLDF